VILRAIDHSSQICFKDGQLEVTYRELSIILNFNALWKLFFYSTYYNKSCIKAAAWTTLYIALEFQVFFSDEEAVNIFALNVVFKNHKVMYYFVTLSCTQPTTIMPCRISTNRYNFLFISRYLLLIFVINTFDNITKTINLLNMNMKISGTKR